MVWLTPTFPATSVNQIQHKRVSRSDGRLGQVSRRGNLSVRGSTLIETAHPGQAP